MNEATVTISGAITHCYTVDVRQATQEELDAMNEDNSDILSTPEQRQRVLDIIDGRRDEPTLPLWFVLHGPSWLINLCFWCKGRARSITAVLGIRKPKE